MAENHAFGKKKAVLRRVLQHSAVESAHTTHSYMDDVQSEAPQEYAVGQFIDTASRFERIAADAAVDTAANATKKRTIQLARHAAANKREKAMPQEEGNSSMADSKATDEEAEPAEYMRGKLPKNETRRTEIVRKKILTQKAVQKEEQSCGSLTQVNGSFTIQETLSSRSGGTMQSALPDTAVRKNLLKKYRRDQLRRTAVTKRMTESSACAVQGRSAFVPAHAMTASVQSKTTGPVREGVQNLLQAGKEAAEKAAALAAKAASELVSVLMPIIGVTGVVVLCVLFIGVIAVIIASPVGILFSDDTGDANAISVSAVIQETNLEFIGELSQIILANPNVDETNITYVYENNRAWNSFWPEIIALFAVNANMGDEMEVITIDTDKAQRIKDVFWDMHQIDYEITQVPDEEDASILYDQLEITVTGKPLAELEAEYPFTAEETEMLNSLLSDEFRDALEAICGLADITGTLLWPLPGYHDITTQFGVDDAFGNPGHKGIDISAPENTPILAAHGGNVVASHFSDSYGNVVMLDDGNGTTTLYAHMISRAVSVGNSVEAGTTIGYVGSTGWSTGNHLHFEVRVGGILTDA